MSDLSDDGTVARRVRVRGRVQGVFFRATATEQATRCGVAGWVRNCADGTVEAWLEGPSRAVDEVEKWMREGPPAARVDAVDVEEASPAGHERFEVRG